jgi:hypothetical protein
MPHQSIRQKLRQGDAVYGVMAAEFFTPGFCQIAGNAGAEFVIFDMEHGGVGIDVLNGSAGFAMAWVHAELYHRVLAYSPTVVNQQWPHNPALPGGAWEYHSAWAGPPVANLSVEGSNVSKTNRPFGSPLIPNSPMELMPIVARPSGFLVSFTFAWLSTSGSTSFSTNSA